MVYVYEPSRINMFQIASLAIHSRNIIFNSVNNDVTSNLIFGVNNLYEIF